MKRAQVDLIGYDVGDDPVSQGNLAIRWAKLTYDENGILTARDNHRILLTPDSDIDATITAVNADLTAQGYGTVVADDVAKIKLHAGTVRTAKVMKAFKDKQKADKAAADKAAADKAAADKAAADAEQQRINALVEAAVTARLAK